MPKAEPLATKRSGIHEERETVSTRNRSQAAASAVGRSPRTRRGGKENRSPTRHEKPSDELSSDEDVDEVDRSTAHLTPGGMYPDLSPFSSSRSGSGSPETNETHQQTLNESYYSTRSHCYSRSAGPRTPEKVPARDQPMTPERGSHGRRIVGEPLERDERRVRRGPTPLMIIGFTLLVIIMMYSMKCQLDKEQKKEPQMKQAKSIDEIKSDWREKFKSIVGKYNQNREVWSQIHGQIDSIMNDSPTQPAVLLVVVPGDATRVAVCLVHELANGLVEAFEDSKFIMYDMKSNGRSKSVYLEEELDRELQGLSTSHTAVIQNIEDIPGDAAMIFHAYCDNENAPYKQAVIFLMIDIKENYLEMSRSKLDVTMDNHLLRLWGERLEMKDASAIVSRVANAPLLIKPVERERLEAFCPL